jgi:prophage regulatory protein
MMLKRIDVLKLVGLSYSTVHRLEKAGNFPARRKLSAGRVAWRLSEVQAWIDGRLCVLS